MGYNSVGKLIKIEGNMDTKKYLSILDEALQPSAQMNGWGHNYILQMDNNPKHTSKAANNYYSENKIKLLPWPSQSPDLNPIEYLWEEVARRMKTSSKLSQKQFEEKMMSIWNEVPQNYLRKIVDSMSRRLNAVLKAHGDNTRYRYENCL